MIRGDDRFFKSAAQAPRADEATDDEEVTTVDVKEALGCFRSILPYAESYYNTTWT